jgi:hypothetical protein
MGAQVVRRVPWVVAAVLVTWAAAPPARSTTVERLTPAELVARAETIVWGDVVDVQADWDAGHQRIYTAVQVAPRELLKGPQAPVVALKLPGGERDGIACVFHGMPRFDRGEEVVLHVTAANPRSGVRVPVGLGQGVRRIFRPARGAAMATRDTRDLGLVLPGARGVLPGALDTDTLDGLLGSIRAEVARQHAAAAGGPR